MQVQLTISTTDALALGLEPGKHAVEIPVGDLSTADRALLADAISRETYTGVIHAFPNVPSSQVYGPTPKSLDAAGLLDALHAAAAKADELRAKWRTDAESLMAELRADKSPFVGEHLTRVFPDLAAEVAAAAKRRQEALVAEGAPEAERLRAQGRLDLNPITGVVYLTPFSNPAVCAALGADLEALKRAAEEEWERIKTDKAAALAAARDAWLGEHGHARLVAKIAARYDCTGGIKAAVRDHVAALVQAAVPYSIVLDREDESDETKGRSTPSDAAFDAAQAVNTLDGCRARVEWGVWHHSDSAAVGREVLAIEAVCPWDSRQTAYVYLEAVSDHFAN